MKLHQHSEFQIKSQILVTQAEIISLFYYFPFIFSCQAVIPAAQFPSAIPPASVQSSCE